MTRPATTGLVRSGTDSTGPLQSSTAAADADFVYVAATNSYRLNLSTAGLADGTWTLSFTAVGDNRSHAVSFKVRAGRQRARSEFDRRARVGSERMSESPSRGTAAGALDGVRAAMRGIALSTS